MPNLVAQIFCAIGKAMGGCESLVTPPVTTIPKPDITFYEIDSKTVKHEFELLNIAIPLGLFDAGGSYYYTTLWGIQEAVKYIRAVYPFPKYTMPRMDCDDFAFLMKGLMSSEFGINDFGFALGNVPGGYHAFCLARTEQKWMFVEPQTGEVFEMGDTSKNYQCDRVII